MPFNAPDSPAGLPVAHSQPCDDKQHFNYPQPCSNQWNLQQGFDLSSRTPNANAIDFTPKPCRNVWDHQDMPENAYEVCRYCIAATEHQQWFKMADTYLRKKPPAHAETNRSRYYLTRLCRLCEEREETLLQQLQGNAPNAIPPVNLPTPRERNLMADWPLNRCICERTALYNNTRCLSHRREEWNSVRPALVTRKAENRNYLVSIQQDAILRRRKSTPATQQRRKENGLWRACRCGADPVATTAEAVVMQCMCCEGIVHFPHVGPGGPQPLNPPPAAHVLRQNSLTAPQRFNFP